MLHLRHRHMKVFFFIFFHYPPPYFFCFSKFTHTCNTVKLTSGVLDNWKKLPWHWHWWKMSFQTQGHFLVYLRAAKRTTPRHPHWPCYLVTASSKRPVTSCHALYAACNLFLRQRGHETALHFKHLSLLSYPTDKRLHKKAKTMLSGTHRIPKQVSGVLI